METLAAAFLLVRSLCTLNKMRWDTHPGPKAAYLILALACFALAFMPLWGLRTRSDELARVLFGVDVNGLAYLGILAALVVFMLFGRRRGEQWEWCRPHISEREQ